MRKIIHLDMDCFYAAIEIRDNSSLYGKPVAVGGGARRGVVATCNYEARKWGVHSAMSGEQARRLCPQIIFIKPNMKKYQDVSQTIRSIMKDITPLVEPLSLDEAYLDVTDCEMFNNSATYISRHLKEKIFKETSLTSSAGVAPNKFLAKVASDWNKPNGIKVIAPDHVSNFVLFLPVGMIPGVGKVTKKKLENLGINTCKDLQEYGGDGLVKNFGKFGSVLYERAFGIDERPVNISRVRKSLSVENTFMDDVVDDTLCHKMLLNLLTDLQQRLHRLKIKNHQRANDELQIKGLFVKVKFADFVITTKQLSCSEISLSKVIETYQGARERSSKAVRLLGLGIYFTCDGNSKKSQSNSKTNNPFKIQASPTADMFAN